MEIRLIPNADLKRAIAKWKDVKSIRNNIFLALLTGLKKISADSKANYLSGPRPNRLGVETGRLRGIQGLTIGPWKGDMLEGRVGYGLGLHATRQISYDWIHERGFHGIENVKGYSRMQNHIFGVPVAPYPVRVPAHTRQMNMPARPYLGPPTFKQYIPTGKRIMDSLIKALK